MSDSLRRRLVAAIVLSGLGVVSAACGSSSTAAAPGRTTGSATVGALNGTITVYAAASLTKSFTELGNNFEAAHPGVTVKFNFDASSALAQQIIAGAPADVFASASKKNMTQVTDKGDAASPQIFAKNTAEIAVAPAAAAKVTNLADLAEAGVKVATCQPQVPCGALAQAVFANAHLTVRPVTQGLDVKSTLAYVTSGEADAALVYVTDVLAAGDKVEGVPIPAAQNSSTSYPIATLRASRNASLAQAFEDFVLSGAGASALSAAGFQKP